MVSRLLSWWMLQLCSRDTEVKLFLFDISLQLSLHSGIGAECVVHDEVVQDLHPRGVLRQVIIILCCNLLHLEQQRHV